MRFRTFLASVTLVLAISGATTAAATTTKKLVLDEVTIGTHTEGEHGPAVGALQTGGVAELFPPEKSVAGCATPAPAPMRFATDDSAKDVATGALSFDCTLGGVFKATGSLTEVELSSTESKEKGRFIAYLDFSTKSLLREELKEEGKTCIYEAPSKVPAQWTNPLPEPPDDFPAFIRIGATFVAKDSTKSSKGCAVDPKMGIIVEMFAVKRENEQTKLKEGGVEAQVATVDKSKVLALTDERPVYSEGEIKYEDGPLLQTGADLRVEFLGSSAFCEVHEKALTLTKNGQTPDVASGSIPLECSRELGSGHGYSISGEAKALELTTTYVINKHGEHEGYEGYIVLAKPLVLHLEEGAGVLCEYTLSGKVKGYFSGEEALGGTESSVIEVAEAPMKEGTKSAKSCPKTKLASFDASAGASALEYELVEVI